MQKNQFRYAVPRKLRMPAVSSDFPVAAFTAEYTRVGLLMSEQAGADGLVAKHVNLQRFGEFSCEQLTCRPQPRQRTLAFAAQ